MVRYQSFVGSAGNEQRGEFSGAANGLIGIYGMIRASRSRANSLKKLSSVA
jgi:hypothetical protein